MPKYLDPEQPWWHLPQNSSSIRRRARSAYINIDITTAGCSVSNNSNSTTSVETSKNIYINTTNRSRRNHRNSSRSLCGQSITTDTRRGRQHPKMHPSSHQHQDHDPQSQREKVQKEEPPHPRNGSLHRSYSVYRVNHPQEHPAQYYLHGSHHSNPSEGGRDYAQTDDNEWRNQRQWHNQWRFCWNWNPSSGPSPIESHISDLTLLSHALILRLRLLVRKNPEDMLSWRIVCILFGWSCPLHQFYFLTIFFFWICPVLFQPFLNFPVIIVGLSHNHPIHHKFNKFPNEIDQLFKF